MAIDNAEVLIKFVGDTKSVDNAVKEQSKSFENLQKVGEATFAGLTLAADAFATSILKGGIEYNAEIETYLTRLETLTGSAEKANNVLEQIKKDALATPFEVSSLTQAESLLLATGIGAEEARADILALGDAVSASGGGNSELQRMAVNLQQIKNVGKASALDIKQFAYAGIDIYGLLADSMGVSREEASKMDITYDMLSKSLQQASQKGGKYYKAMEKQSKTYKGAMSNLKESVDVFKGAIAEDLFNALKGIIPPLTDFFNWMTKNKDIILAITVPLLTFINVFAGLMIVQKVVGLFQTLWLLLSANPITLIIAAIAALVAAFIYLWNNCEDFRNFWIGLWDGLVSICQTAIDFIVGLFNTVVDFIKNNWQGILLFIVNPFAGAFKLLYDNFEGFRNFVDGIMNGIKNIISGVANFFSSAFETAVNGVKSAFEGIKSVAKTVMDAVVQIIKLPINTLIDGLNSFIGALNKIKIPDWVPGVGGKGLHFDKIKKLATGTNYVPQDMIAMIHKGEAVVPKKFNPYANSTGSSIASSINGGSKPIINVYANFETDPLGQVVSNIKTFSGGAKNDYNYGGGV